MTETKTMTEVDRVRLAMRLGTATLFETQGGQALSPQIHQMTPGLGMAGRAFPVRSPGRDNLWLHRAVAVAKPGDVIVATFDGVYEAGYFGEILAWAARARGVVGVVLDGCVRDVDRLPYPAVPVFARGTCIRGTAKDPNSDGAVDVPVQVGDVLVRPNDFVVGDADGVVVLAAETVDHAIDLGCRREEREADYISQIQAGRTTMQLLELPDWNGGHRGALPAGAGDNVPVRTDMS